MTNLTEQWKKGELEWDREYYVDLENNGIVKQLYLDEDGCFFDGIIDYSLKNKPYMEVLAPVPSYEEWQKVLNIDFNNEVLRLENAKLKELLKECQHMILAYSINHDIFKKDEVKDITTKTDEVLK